MLREEKVAENPFALVSIPKAQKKLPEFFYEAEMMQLFNACEASTPLGQRNKALLELLYATGIRVSECSQIRLKDLDMYLSTVLVRGKGSKERYVPFGSFAQDALDTYINHGREKLLANGNVQENLFLNARGGPLTARGIRTILDRIIEKSSLTGKIHPHMLRHTFATHLMANGADMRTVQELLGHAFLSSTQVYTHVTNEYLKKLIWPIIRGLSKRKSIPTSLQKKIKGNMLQRRSLSCPNFMLQQYLLCIIMENVQCPATARLPLEMQL